MTKRQFLPGLLLVVALVGGLGCSVGTLLVRVPTPTLQPTKTPRPTFTFTPNWTPTPSPSPTVTITPVPPTITPTSPATLTPTPAPPTATATKVRRPTPTPAPQAPTDTPTPTPAPPAATPTPQFAFSLKDQVVHNIGGVALETRVTAFITVCSDVSKGYCDCGDSYQIALIDPSGREHLGSPSGGRNHTTGPGLGDDHWFSAEVKFSPYAPGAYKARLVKGGMQQSPEVEFILTAVPSQYVWLWFDAPPGRAAARPCG